MRNRNLRIEGLSVGPGAHRRIAREVRFTVVNDGTRADAVGGLADRPFLSVDGARDRQDLLRRRSAPAGRAGAGGEL